MSKTIVLLNPPITLQELYGDLSFAADFQVPLNLLYLAATVREAGFNVHVIDPQVRELDFDSCIDAIRELAPDYIGLSFSFAYALPQSRRFATKIKECFPDTKLIAGGVHFSACPEVTMRESIEIDYGIVGEGEESLVELLETLDKKEDIVSVEGIIYRNGEDFIRTTARPLIADLDKLPLPAWDLVDMNSYGTLTHNDVLFRSTLIITARGCPYPCTFCDRTVLGKKFRVNSPEYIAKMIDHLHTTYGINDFAVRDENISASKKHLKVYCDIMKARPGLTFTCLMRAQNVDNEMVEMMTEGGCRDVFVGIESASDHMLEMYQKKVTAKEMQEAVTIMRRGGLSIYASYIVGGPGETKESLQETMKFVKETSLETSLICFFIPFVGTPAYDNIEQHGKMISDDLNKFNGQNVVFVPNGFTEQELIEWKDRLHKAAYFSPRFIFTKLMEIRSPKQLFVYASLGFKLLLTLFGKSKK